jgi:primosomal protein N' (replication factor Y)
VNMRAEFQQSGEERLISSRLADAIGERLARGEQTLVLLNRRGYAPVVLCRNCGEAVECRNCAISMTHHLRKQRLECHYCGYTRPVPETCPKCGSEYVQFVGSGAERLQETLHGLFPRARIARLDRDTVRGRHDVGHVLALMNDGKIDILAGTQMIAKGHDVHGVTLVGIVGADLALGLPDFRAAERTFQLLTQAAGRAGRGETAGSVILQTYFPEHYAIQFAAQHDYRGFFEKELQFRRWMHYPPFTALANVLVRGPELEQTLAIVGKLGNWFREGRHPRVRVLGPAAAPLVRLKRDFRYHFILKSDSRAALNTTLRGLLQHAAAEKITRSQLIVDVDALSLL